LGLCYLIRHGVTEWNATGLLCGRSDVPLSDDGRRQAERLAARLESVPFAALYVSPLVRAVETARIVSRSIHLEPVIDERLYELNYGDWEGSTFAEIRKNQPDFLKRWMEDPGAVAPPGGESGYDAERRAASFLDSMAAKHPQDNVAVVCHKTISRLAICHILGMPVPEYRKRLAMANAAFHVIRSSEEGWMLISYNETSHLTEGVTGGFSESEQF
jgi:broad specificity phosphatase PhoE